MFSSFFALSLVLNLQEKVPCVLRLKHFLIISASAARVKQLLCLNHLAASLIWLFLLQGDFRLSDIPGCLASFTGSDVVLWVLISLPAFEYLPQERETHQILFDNTILKPYFNLQSFPPVKNMFLIRTERASCFPVKSRTKISKVRIFVDIFTYSGNSVRSVIVPCIQPKRKYRTSYHLFCYKSRMLIGDFLCKT